MNMPDESLKMSEQIKNIRRLLNEDEQLVLQMKLDGRSDKQIAALMGISISAVNQKKHALYQVIKSLSWWQLNKDRVLREIEKKLNRRSADLFGLAAERRRQYEIAARVGISAWKVNKIMGPVIELAGKDEGLRQFVETLRLGYHLPWKKGR